MRLRRCIAPQLPPKKKKKALEENGEEFVHKHVGREPSGRKHNEMALKKILEENRGDEPERTAIPHNPMINVRGILGNLA